MVSYTLAATSALVWGCVAYLRSTRLRRRGPSVALGVLLGVLGVLGLTRVLALVNLAAFLTVLLIAQVARRRRPGS